MPALRASSECEFRVPSFSEAVMFVCHERGVFSYREGSSFMSGFALRPDRQTRICTVDKRYARQIAAGRE